MNEIMNHALPRKYDCFLRLGRVLVKEGTAQCKSICGKDKVKDEHCYKKGCYNK